MVHGGSRFDSHVGYTDLSENVQSVGFSQVPLILVNFRQKPSSFVAIRQIPSNSVKKHLFPSRVPPLHRRHLLVRGHKCTTKINASENAQEAVLKGVRHKEPSRVDARYRRRIAPAVTLVP